ncbi:MAG: glycosyltransferase [Magnetococcales bacterium]|nr:glycosyltransferase [Magnetococcales bacterium]MBF0114299.1 glycosyltransferase [Magnetococcales bacterium]
MKPLRLAIVSALLHSSHGGPATVVQRHYQALRQHMEVVIIGVAPQTQQAHLLTEYPESHLFPPVWPARWFRGRGLADALWQILPDCDVVHAHMLWDHPVWAACRTARALNKPCIITPHGSLMETWRYQALHKRLYRWLLLDRLLQQTTFLHALSEQEKHACQQAGVTTPIRVIANGLPDSAFLPSPAPLQSIDHWPALHNQAVLLYLGRLWQEKGLDDLLTAWGNLCRHNQTQGWQLVLAGPDYRGYRHHLETRIAQEGLGDKVHLPGEVTGQKKTDLFAMASAFVLPSYSEGLSTALLEAMAAGLPAVYTQQCHFPTLSQHQGGIEIPVGTAGVQQGITRLLRLSPAQRRAMGDRARALALRDYTMDTIATALHALYQEALQTHTRH